MDDPQLLDRMRADWNQRAGEDANYYAAFARRGQDDQEFFASGAEVVRDIESQLYRLKSRDAALEIGCGPGRLLRPLSRHFREIHGVDISDEMVRLARERLRDVPNAHTHLGSGAGLEMFPDAKFDFVYSYAVFQHIPSREVVFGYLREAQRVLKPGGILRCQLYGLPPHARQYDTWSGVRITPEEISQFTRENGFHLLAVEQVWAQYMWITCRKRAQPRIRSITNALSGEAAAPASGPLAALSIWVENLPAECDLNSIAVTADGLPCRGTFIGEPAHDGLTQVNAALPQGLRTGLVPITLAYCGEPLCAPTWARIIPPGPAVPGVVSVVDGINLRAGHRIGSGIIKVTMVDVADPAAFQAGIDDVPVTDIESFCTDALMRRYEFNLPLPPSVSPGPHQVRIRLGRREFVPVPIEVA
jgi:ubiquinone/menaquinone biosynthesis C-methylase UbiE